MDKREHKDKIRRGAEDKKANGPKSKESRSK